MIRAHLIVAVADDEQDAEGGEAPTEEFDEVERRFVGPMHVFEDQDGGQAAAAQFLDRDVEATASRRSAASRAPGKLAADLARDVIKRRQRMRREERFAATP